MSITIMQTDNMNVIISKGSQLVGGIGEECTEIDNLNIIVNILVNGKMKQLFQPLDLKDGNIKDHRILCVLTDTLMQLGYESRGMYDKVIKGVEKL